MDVRRTALLRGIGDLMKIDIDKDSSDEFYGEVLAVVTNYGKIADNPRRKVRSPTTPALLYAGISAAFILIFSFLYLSDKSQVMYFFVIVLFTVTLILCVPYYLLTLRRMAKLMTNGRKKSLVIEDNHVEMTVDGESTRVEMSQIKHIVVNNHSIAFIPKDISSKIIAVDRQYQDEVVGAVKDKSLIVDNSDLY